MYIICIVEGCTQNLSVVSYWKMMRRKTIIFMDPKLSATLQIESIWNWLLVWLYVECCFHWFSFDFEPSLQLHLLCPVYLGPIYLPTSSSPFLKVDEYWLLGGTYYYLFYLSMFFWQSRDLCLFMDVCVHLRACPIDVGLPRLQYWIIECDDNETGAISSTVK